MRSLVAIMVVSFSVPTMAWNKKSVKAHLKNAITATGQFVVPVRVSTKGNTIKIRDHRTDTQSTYKPDGTIVLKNRFSKETRDVQVLTPIKGTKKYSRWKGVEQSSTGKRGGFQETETVTHSKITRTGAYVKAIKPVVGNMLLGAAAVAGATILTVVGSAVVQDPGAIQVVIPWLTAAP